MRERPPRKLTSAALFAAMALVFSGCDNHGSSLFNNTNGNGNAGNTSNNFAVVSCSLGGSPCGGGVNIVSQNQTISFVFSSAVNSATVTPETLSIQELDPSGGGGAEPPGLRTVSGNVVFFQPEVSFNSNGNVSYGFKPNTTYRLRIPSLPNTAIEGANGKINSTAIEAFFVINTDLNDVVPGPPSACLTKPIASVNVPSNAPVEITFNDIMNAATLVNKVNGTSSTLAVKVDLDGNPGTTNDQVNVTGIWDIAFNTAAKKTIVSFTHPTVSFPGPGPLDNHLIVVTMTVPSIEDLGGNSLDATKDCNGAPYAPNAFPFRFKTVPVPATTFTFAEEFNDSGKDDGNSTGTDMWDGPAAPGELRRGFAGGRGTLGDFFATIANDASQVGAYATDGVASINPLRTPFTVNATTSLDGVDTTVTDGVFQFGSFIIPSGVTVRFEGPFPTRIYSRGIVKIDGILDVGGLNASKGDPAIDAGMNTPCLLNSAGSTVLPSFPQFPFGKKGARGGSFAGDGGSGGDLPPNCPNYIVPPPSVGTFVSFHGRKGKDAPGSLPTATGGGASEAVPVVVDPTTLQDFFGNVSPASVSGGVFVDQNSDAFATGIVITNYSVCIASIQLGAAGGGGGSFFEDGTSGGWCTIAPPAGQPCVLVAPLGFSGASPPNGKLPVGSNPPESLVKSVPPAAQQGYFPIPPPGQRGFKGTSSIPPSFGDDGLGNFAMLRGGGGGGGGGVNTHGTSGQTIGANWNGGIPPNPPPPNPTGMAPLVSVGGAGGGGGGAVQIQAGRDLLMVADGVGNHGVIDASGGNGGDHVDPPWFSTLATPKCNNTSPNPANQFGMTMAPGGGGGGGSALLQAAGTFTLANQTISLRGGIGGQGKTFNTFFTGGTAANLPQASRLRGGDGGIGRAHYQFIGVNPNLTLPFDPPTAVTSSTFLGVNPTAADASGAQSKFYDVPALGIVFQLTQFEVTIVKNTGTQVLIQDDVTHFDVTNGSYFNGGPLPFRILFQGARTGPDGLPNPLTFSAWTDSYTSLSKQSPEFLRFVVIFDRASAVAHPEFLGIDRIEFKGATE